MFFIKINGHAATRQTAAPIFNTSSRRKMLNLASFYDNFDANTYMLLRNGVKSYFKADSYKLNMLKHTHYQFSILSWFVWSISDHYFSQSILERFTSQNGKGVFSYVSTLESTQKRVKAMFVSRATQEILILSPGWANTLGYGKLYKNLFRILKRLY